ncbi:MAG: glycosyltransferase [Acidimicrobiales bacterium]
MRRVALAHDFLTQRGGAERVFLAMARAFPEAPLLTTVYEPKATYPEFADHEVRTSPLQRVRPFRRNFRAALPLYPWAVRRLGPVDADVLVSSSTSFVHALRSRGCHIGYLYSPPHWLWDTARYTGATRSAVAAKRLLGRMRTLDLAAAATPHLFVTCSANAAGKIHDTYGRWAEVLAPPVRQRPAAPERGDFFLVVSRLLPYKRIDLAIEAAGRLGARLVVVGRGPDGARLRALAGPGTEFREQVTDAELDDLYARCLALVMPGNEDLGLVPIEAASAGRPAVCLAEGGALETVVPDVTGILVAAPGAGPLAEAMAAAAARSWDGPSLQRHAAGWSEEAFARKLRLLVEHFPGWCRRCGGEGLGPFPMQAIIERHGPEGAEVAT